MLTEVIFECVICGGLYEEHEFVFINFNYTGICEYCYYSSETALSLEE